MKRILAGSCGVIVAGVPGGLVALAMVEVLPRLGGRRRPVPDGIEVAARLLVLIGTGLPLLAALEVASLSMAGMENVTRRARRLGTAAALASASGPLAPLFQRLANAAASGSPPETAIRAYIDIERRRRQTEALEWARRLPVRLMVPMTLLVLPGFVLMIYGPAFIDLVGSLLGPLVG